MLAVERWNGVIFEIVFGPELAARSNEYWDYWIFMMIQMSLQKIKRFWFSKIMQSYNENFAKKE